VWVLVDGSAAWGPMFDFWLVYNERNLFVEFSPPYIFYYDLNIELFNFRYRKEWFVGFGKLLFWIIIRIFFIFFNYYYVNSRNKVNCKLYWCESCNHVVTWFIIKIEIWSWKLKKDLIGMWHNENLPQGINIIRMKSNNDAKPINLW
jgi:hypothetical protein